MKIMIELDGRRRGAFLDAGRHINDVARETWPCLQGKEFCVEVYDQEFEQFLEVHTGYPITNLDRFRVVS